MVREVQTEGPYSVPSVFHVKYSKLFIGNLLLVDILWLYITYSFITEGKTILFKFDDIITVLLWFLLILLLNADFVHSQILRKQYLELNEDGIFLKTFFTNRSMKWQEIDYAKVVPGVRGYRGLIVVSVTKYNPYPKVDKLGIKYDLKYSNISPERLNQTIRVYKN